MLGKIEGRSSDKNILLRKGAQLPAKYLSAMLFRTRLLTICVSWDELCSGVHNLFS